MIARTLAVSWLAVTVCALALAPAEAGSDRDLYASTMHRVRALSNSPNVRLLPFGRSLEGRSVPALVITDFTVRPDHKSRIMVIAGQHGDEPGPVRSLLSLCERLASGDRPPVLSRCALLVLPMANPDGAAAGSRFTADGLDTNRDWLCLASVETRHMDSLIRAWKPHVLLDLHEWNETPPIPANEIEAAPCVTEAQLRATRALASTIAQRAGLAVLECRPGGSPGMFHRRYTARGHAAFLVETAPGISLERKSRFYESAVLAAVGEATSGATDLLALSPASEGFCLSMVRRYLDPVPSQARPHAHTTQVAALVAIALGLIGWLAKPVQPERPAWSRRFRKCAVDPSIAAPLAVERSLKPITLRSWAHRRTRSRYATVTRGHGQHLPPSPGAKPVEDFFL